MSLAAAALALSVPISGCVYVDVGRHYTERQEKTFSVTGTPQLTLTTSSGPIEVEAWERPDVRVVAEKYAFNKADADDIEVITHQSGNRIDVETHRFPIEPIWFIRWDGTAYVRFSVSVPTSADVKVRARSGSIHLDGVSGAIDAETRSGSIAGRQLSGDVGAYTRSGSITLENIAGTLSAETSSGRISVVGTLTKVVAQSRSGSVTVQAKSGSAANADWDIGTSAGSVRLEIPPQFSGELVAGTRSGRIALDGVPLTNVIGHRVPHTVQGRMGAGGRTLRLHSRSGSISVRTT